MFFVNRILDEHDEDGSVIPYPTLDQALDRARSEALYGDWQIVEVWGQDGGCLVLFQAQEMRDATRQQREAREVQEFPRVCPSL
jgi:hypothetical protein